MNHIKTTLASAIDRKCWSLDEFPPHFKQRYQRLALITHDDHLQCLDTGDDETLIVSCNWLLWQKALAEGLHCVHYEMGLLEWDGTEVLSSEIIIRANDWIYDRTESDMTMFRGVSLGKMFAGDLMVGLINYHRMSQALRGLSERFKPEEVVFYDFANDIDILDWDFRRQVVEFTATELGLRFRDGGRGGDRNKGVRRVPEQAMVQTAHGIVKQTLVTVYARVLEAVFVLRSLFRDREKRVLILVNQNMMEPLLTKFDGRGFTPSAFVRGVPRNPRLLWHCFLKGVLLLAQRKIPLSSKDRERLLSIQATLDIEWAAPVTGLQEFMRTYVRQRILEKGKLETQAIHVRSAEELLGRCRPRRLVVDGLKSPASLIFVELARTLDMEVDYIWHSPHTSTYTKFDALGSDPRSVPKVTRCLSWGNLNDDWLDGVEAKQPRIRVGSPLGDKFLNSGNSNNEASTPPEGCNRGNVLLLQYTPQLDDLKGLNANIYKLFVDCARRLPGLGYPNIVMKLHPGWRCEKSYFEEIRYFFGLECKVMKTEPYEECVAWADIVAGPITTGALWETLAAGKPYYAFLLHPHGMDPAFYRYPHLSSVDDFVKSLSEKEKFDGAPALTSVYSLDKFPSGSKRFWEVLRSDFE